jgi:hypothetical protein
MTMLDDTENWREAERAEYREIKLSPTEIEALKHFDTNPGTPLLTKADPSRMIVNKLCKRQMLYQERRGFSDWTPPPAGPGPIRYRVSVYGVLWLIHNRDEASDKPRRWIAGFRS